MGSRKYNGIIACRDKALPDAQRFPKSGHKFCIGRRPSRIGRKAENAVKFLRTGIWFCSTSVGLPKNNHKFCVGDSPTRTGWEAGFSAWRYSLSHAQGLPHPCRIIRAGVQVLLHTRGTFKEWQQILRWRTALRVYLGSRRRVKLWRTDI